MLQRKNTLYALLTAALLSGAAQADAPPVRSVTQIDLNRYVGKWYEIAAFPMYFQRNCIADTTAEYTLRPDGELTVDNRCRTESGVDQAIGRAWAVDAAGAGQLKVSFFWPFRSDYWVIGLDPDYRWAVVGNPNRKYLWILSRTPQLPAAELERARQAASAQGYDLDLLKTTRQTETAP
ncbi:lipocalin family protein [Quatrionicoccus australiensis]|uniref:lipocalin family protein n=1 Tax=Quatrionicoccus australiensis TaxID=138118 RepID=UPI001CFA9C71|nr:lipocalin family protein [Quatrionicoccus australiensis]MCB4361592.1 lipocalin family protein [Quatrionicoccus australiensis]